MGYSASFHSRVLGLCVAGAASAAWSQTLQPVPQADAEQLAERISAWDAARQARPRRVLVFWRCEGFVHGKALEYGNETLTRAGKAFAADLSNDYAVFAPENLAKYDAVVLNNTTALDTREHPFIEPALIGYVQSGKGLAVIHAGADNFYKAERAAEMVGGRFWGHPWGSGGTWAFKLDEPGHPLNRAFGGKGIAFGDEIYQQQSPFYNRAKLRVLVSLDLSDAATAAANGQRRDDKDYAVSWIRPYGKGRVFYTSFGHDQRAFLDKAVVVHILDGIQYAIGDLKADDAPGGLSEADLARVRGASDEHANEVFAFLQDTVAHTYHARTASANRAKLEALLKDPTTSTHGKRVILRIMLSMGAPADLDPVAALQALTRLGTGRHVSAIAALIGREGAVGRSAVETLQDMRAKDAGAALFALAEREPDRQAKLLPVLGERMESALLPRFAPFVTSDRAEVRREAWKALGKAADERSCGTLLAWLPQIREEELNQAEAAVRAAAKNLEPAARTSSFVAAWGKSGPVAKRALASLMTGYSDPAFLAPLTGALAAPEASVRETALRQLGEWPSMEPFAALKAAVAAQGDAALKQVALRSALKLAAAQGGAGARDRFVELFKVAPDDKGRQSVADAVFRRDSIDLFPLLRGLFDDAACGGAAKALYRRFYDEKLKQQATQPLREITPEKWKANASHGGRDAPRAFDRKPETRWTTGRTSEKGMWFTLDLGENVYVSEVVLDTQRSANDTPNGYEVFASTDGKTWTGPVAKGDGNHTKKTVIPLSVQTRHLKFVTTGGRGGLYWSIHEITVKAGLDQKKVEEIRAVAESIR